MSFKVFGTPVEKQVFLKLAEVEGCIMLQAVDQYGARVPQGNIMKITTDGKLYRCSSVNPDIGLKLDDDGCVLVVD